MTAKGRHGKMMIDCHTHVNFPAGDIELSEHIEACSSFDACIVLPVSKTDNGETNSQLSRYVKKHQKMLGFAVVNPIEDKIAPKLLDKLIDELGLSGIVVYCASSGFHPAHSRAMRLYELIEQKNVPIFFNNSSYFNHNAVMDYSQPCMLDEIARAFPDLKIIIGSMGLPFYLQTICMLTKHDNVFADLTVSPRKLWQIYNIIVTAHESGVMDKLIFGSGYPFAKPAECIETLLGFNKMLGDGVWRPVPREKIRNIIERDSLALLDIKK
jgi:hypothetical protein